MEVSELEFFVREEGVVVGHSIDGDVHGEAYFVIAEDRDGRRWAHHHRFVNRYYCEDGSAEVGEPVFGFDAEAEAKAEALCAQIEAAESLRPEFWAVIPARYGSAAHNERDHYDEDDIGAMRAKGIPA